MNQLQYAWDDLKSQKTRNIILLIQILAALMLFSLVLSLLFNLRSFSDKLYQLTGRQDIYFSRDMTDPGRFAEIMSSPDSNYRLKELYSFMTNNYTAFTADAQQLMWLNDDNLDGSFIVRRSDTGKGYNLLKINETYLKVYDLSTVEGTGFTSQDFQADGNTIPLLLGFNFRSFFQLGDTITDTGGSKYQVTGFLEKSTYFLQPGKSGEIYLLDTWFVIPVHPKSIVDYDSAIMSTYILAENPSILETIQQKSTELGLYTFEFRSFTDQMQLIQEDFNIQMSLIGFMLIVILLFSITGLTSNIAQFIDSHTREFAIHLLCGAQVNSVIQRILIHIFLMIMPACILVFIIHRFSKTTVFTILFSLMIGCLVAIYPAIKLSRLGINSLLRRSE
jgi:hypothetical protein